MKFIKQLIDSVRELPTKYPAIISAYIIYSYLFFVMLRFFVLTKQTTLSFYDIVEIFDALPFMWFLAVTLVKVIDIRTKLHNSETQRIRNEQNLHLKETQIDTMHEVVLGLQHQINNPLAIIMLTIHKAKRTIPDSSDLNTMINLIRDQSARISSVLNDFIETQNYEIEQIGSTLNSMAIPEKQA